MSTFRKGGAYFDKAAYKRRRKFMTTVFYACGCYEGKTDVVCPSGFFSAVKL
jgi:hypothetical protein